MSRDTSREFIRKPAAGGMMLVLVIVLTLMSIALIVAGARADAPPIVLGGAFWFLVSIFLSIGFFIVTPNHAAVLIFFGKYAGSVKDNGFWWVNPFTVRKKISLRARNFNGDRLKVNDKAGNPIEIAAVVVWEVQNTYQALFDVDDYDDYVHTQSESAVRHLAVSYPYDASDAEHEAGELSLRGDIDTVSEKLELELADRLKRAGVRVVEARLAHLAYAPEIAGAMLRRQQADAIIAARYKIVEGAVGMVENALERLSHGNIVELDDERRAAMVSNLMVVLCSQEEAHPVVNAGSLY
ncbi:MAG: SPFH domain-containing protein [Gemmatimonadetes bacterium]|nr:SPFH domain-containing protein [Gemmatimonadota bacterium]